MIAKLNRVLGRLVAAVLGPRATGSASASGGRTGPQMIGASGSGVLGPAPRLGAGYETYRRMRRDPTIALARALAVAPVVAGKWTVQADADVPQEIRGWIGKQFLTVREPLLETILKHGYVDFGHQAFELVWGLDVDGRQHVVRFKPLLPDITEILIDNHGGLAGLRQKDVELTGTGAMLVSFGGEGSNLYGEPLLENVREAWNDWRKANEVAARYDRKIAGAYLLLHYPSFGQGIDQNGAKLDNVYLAQRILDKLEAASGVAIGDVPSELAPGQDPNQTAWRLEVQGSAGGQQQGFVDRLRYLDSLKVRGMLLPERAILEGQHGTLAESQSQGDLALLQAELVHHHLTREINRQAVDPVLEANWGPAYRGKVRLEAAPLSDANQGFLRRLVTQVLSDPKDFTDLFRRADWSAIFDAVGLPQTKASCGARSSPSAIVTAVRRLHRQALEGSEAAVSQTSGREWHPKAGLPVEDLAVESQGAHTEGDAAGVGLANFNPDEPRDRYGRWTKVGSDAEDETDTAEAASETGGHGATSASEGTGAASQGDDHGGSPPTASTGAWDPKRVGDLIKSTPTGMAVLDGVRSSRVMQCEKVVSYVQERKTPMAPWPDSWKGRYWGAMKDVEDGKPTLHVPRYYDTYQAARFLVHEGTHALGKGEQDAYTTETQFAIDLLRQSPNDKDAKSLLRPGMYKQGQSGPEVDAQGIKDFLNTSTKSDYEAWAGNDPIKRFKQNT
jgi:hypothetical protein